MDPWVSAVMSAVLSGGVFAGFAAWRRSGSESRMADVTAMVAALGAVQAQVETYSAQVAALEAKLSAAQDRIGRLEAWIRLNTAYDPEHVV